MKNCAKQPLNTAFGFVKTTLKSTGFNVIPIQNITTPNNQLIDLLDIHPNEAGQSNAKTATNKIRIAI